MTSMHFSEEAWVPGGERHQLSLTTSEAPGDWARGTDGPARALAHGAARLRGGAALALAARVDAARAGGAPSAARAKIKNMVYTNHLFDQEKVYEELVSKGHFV